MNFTFFKFQHDTTLVVVTIDKSKKRDVLSDPNNLVAFPQLEQGLSFCYNILRFDTCIEM